ncbi:MAG: quinone-dependent dihydroorotate dehydrogenase [Thermomicrobiales bacterium]
MTIYQQIDRQLMQRMGPEPAHELALKGLSLAAGAPGGLAALSQYAPEPDERLRTRLWDLPFVNPLGVAAGLDKNAVAVRSLLAIGFGHVEVGTVTLQPQVGNDKPRLWRVPEENAVVNALGFPSQGAATVRGRLHADRPQGIVGVNIGKNRDIPAEQAPEAYAALTLAMGDVASYITVNVSSPNTPGLRSLQMSDELENLLKAVKAANEQLATARKQLPKPILVKVAPDLSREEIEAVAWSAVSAGADGIIATNTTTSRDGIPGKYADLPGGLSGPPLRERANAVVRTLYEAVGDQLPIIGVGGVSNAGDVIERMRAGASLVQLYTAFIYAGLALPGTILRDLSAFIERENLRSIGEIVGQG